MKKYNLRKAAAAAAAGAMLLSNMGYAQEANVYDQKRRSPGKENDPNHCRGLVE